MADKKRTEGIPGAIEYVVDKFTLLVHEEIELAKAELTSKMNKLARGAVLGVVAAVFLIFSLIYVFNAAAWGIWQLTGLQTNYWVGFATVALLLLITGGLAVWGSTRLFKKGAPPTPDMAIQEAQEIKKTVVAAGKPQVDPEDIYTLGDPPGVNPDGPADGGSTQAGSSPEEKK